MSVLRQEQWFYTPGDDAKTALENFVLNAQENLDVEIYNFTDLILANNIISCANRGVKVRIMNDRSQALGTYDHLILQALVDANEINENIQVKIVESEKSNIDHLKQVIKDASLYDTCFICTGSINFTKSSQTQDNLFIITNDPGKTRQAIDKFNHDWEFNKSDPSWQIKPTTKEKILKDMKLEN